MGHGGNGTGARANGEEQIGWGKGVEVMSHGQGKVT